MTDRAMEPWAFEDVRKDPLDVRDWTYVPSLQPLPPQIDNRPKAPRPIRDQGKEGSCTGFGLMAVANYLIHNRPDIGPLKVSVSPRMFYEMAKRYDEWAGEKYGGSSIRGAMKGWHKHGVCLETEWPYVEDQHDTRLTPRRQHAALKRPLGAYFRVRHLHLNHMHSALHEVGILYASAATHKGWGNVDREGHIPFQRPSIGGHAFAVVGYDADGFWIQNSWGPNWGLGGFGHISYDDWLENSYDCWVAQLGVPTPNLTFEERTLGRRVATFDFIPQQTAVLDRIRPHFVDLGNGGELSASGLYSSDAREVRDIIQRSFRAKAQEWGTARLFLYAHGGLNDEKACATRIDTMLPCFLANQIYPLHFMWETGLLDTLRDIGQDALRQPRFEGWIDSMKERFVDLLDEAIELAARIPGRALWKEMKENAKGASASMRGGAALVARQIAELAEKIPVELHLAGHSAGSVLLAHLILRLGRLGVPIKTLTLYAPACTTELFKSNILNGLRDGSIERLTIFNLTDEYEKRDTATLFYHKSLLYLVSGACEERRNEPLLGMDTFIERDEKLKGAVGEPVGGNDSTVIYSVGGPSGILLASNSRTHGGFDDDEATLNSTLRIVRATKELEKEFEASPR